MKQNLLQYIMDCNRLINCHNLAVYESMPYVTFVLKYIILKNMQSEMVITYKTNILEE